MKTWIFVGLFVAILIALLLWSEGGRIFEGAVQETGTTTEDTISSATTTPDETEPAGVSTVDIALIALEDNGATGKKIGCNDSVVLVPQQVTQTQAPLRAALLQLLSIKDATYGQSGLYTSLASGDLSLADVRIENGEAVIELEGSLALGGVCDNPRVAAQLEETALQFDTVNEVSVLLNGEPLEEVLSGE